MSAPIIKIARAKNASWAPKRTGSGLQWAYSVTGDREQITGLSRTEADANTAAKQAANRIAQLQSCGEAKSCAGFHYLHLKKTGAARHA